VRGSRTSQEAFQQIDSILNQLAAENLNSVPADSMGDDLIALQRIDSRVQAEALRRLRRFDGGQGYANSLALSAKGWLRWKCNLTYTAASNQVEGARALESLPQTSEAFADGDISYRHASLIASTSGSWATRWRRKPRKSSSAPRKSSIRSAWGRLPRTFGIACSRMKCFETPTRPTNGASFI